MPQSNKSSSDSLQKKTNRSKMSQSKQKHKNLQIHLKWLKLPTTLLQVTSKLTTIRMLLLNLMNLNSNKILSRLPKMTLRRKRKILCPFQKLSRSSSKDLPQESKVVEEKARNRTINQEPLSRCLCPTIQTSMIMTMMLETCKQTSTDILTPLLLSDPHHASKAMLRETLTVITAHLDLDTVSTMVVTALVAKEDPATKTTQMAANH